MDKLIVCDIAGTTLQDFNEVNKSFVDAFNSFNIFPSKEQIDKVMGLSKPLAIQLILKDLKISMDPLQIHKSFLYNMIQHYSDKNNVREIPGTTHTFKALKEKGYKIALDTGFSQDITDVIIKTTGWLENGIIDAVISSDQVSSGRPYPYMIYHIMETLQIQSIRNVIKVGDTISDIQEGLNAGCGVVIGVTSGTYSRQQFEKYPGNFYILPDVTHIPSLLESIKNV